MTTGKIIALNIWAFFSKMMSLLFNTLSGFVIAFLSRNMCLLISWLQSPSTVILESKKIFHSFHLSLFICREVMGPDSMILVLWMLSFKTAFSLTSFPFTKRLFSTSLVSDVRVVSSAYLGVVDISSSSLDYSRSGSDSPLNLLFSFNIILDFMINHKYFVAQLLSCIQLFATPRTAAWQDSLSFTIYWSLLKLMSIKSVMPSNHLILCHPLLLHSIFPSIRVFSNESALRIRWPKYWTSASASVLPMNIEG